MNIDIDLCETEEDETSVDEKPRDTIVAKEGVASGEIEKDRLRRERQHEM